MDKIKRNPYAAALKNKLFAPKVIDKGKKSAYTRKSKHKKELMK